jgi:hypothetical protein
MGAWLAKLSLEAYRAEFEALGVFTLRDLLDAATVGEAKLEEAGLGAEDIELFAAEVERAYD